MTLDPDLAGGEHPSPDADEPSREGREAEPALPGTLFVLMLFLAAVVGLWGTVYWMLLTR